MAVLHSLLSCLSEIGLDFSNQEARMSHLIVPCTFLLFMFRIYYMIAWRIHDSSFPVVPTGNLEMRINSLKLGKALEDTGQHNLDPRLESIG